MGPSRPGRRGFLASALAALLTPVVAGAQPGTNVRRVGILGSSTRENFADNVRIFRDALHALGWEEGRTLAIEARYADERYEQLPRLASQLIALKVDVIFALATPAIEAARRATTTIPIVIETLGDALGTGLVPNLARPGGNVTGVSGFAPELSGKRLALIRDLLPSAERIGLLVNRTNAATAVVVRAAEDAAQQMRVQLVLIDVRQRDALDAAFERLVRERCEAFVLAADPMLFSLRRRIVELAARHRLPAAYEYRLFTEMGGLLSYGPDPHERFRQAAAYVDRILRGAVPGDLPVERPSKFELILNMKTARQLNLTIPPAVQLRADRVIE